MGKEDYFYTFPFSLLNTVMLKHMPAYGNHTGYMHDCPYVKYADTVRIHMNFYNSETHYFSFVTLHTSVVNAWGCQ